MALRLGGLADLDPRAVPLPLGTAVATRVDGYNYTYGRRVSVAIFRSEDGEQ